MVLYITVGFIITTTNIFLLWCHLKLVKANYFLRNGYVFCEIVMQSDKKYYGYVLRSDFISYESLPYMSTCVFPIYNSKKVLITSSEIISMNKIYSVLAMIFKGGSCLWRTFM